MPDKTCKQCGFMILGDDGGPAVTDWICDVCQSRTGGNGELEIPTELVAPPTALESLTPQEPAAPVELSAQPIDESAATAFSPIVEEKRATPGKGNCPQCYGKFKVREDKYGKNVYCPHCKQVVHVSETGDFEEYDEFAHYLKHKAKENQGDMGPRHTGVYTMQEGTGAPVQGPIEETEEEEKEVNPIVLFVFGTLPLFGMLVAVFLPKVLDKVEKMVKKVLPLLAG